ncbi:protein kinase domain-containing protein [Gordonia sp. DT30]|uniref:protein kinase domain-containing protein n=1 Tax=unclassified Gordonia (in: high G+C Gram-positive bacteria) TaxID=2657482 RepID=UPI003CE86F77
MNATNAGVIAGRHLIGPIRSDALGQMFIADPSVSTHSASSPAVSGRRELMRVLSVDPSSPEFQSRFAAGVRTLQGLVHPGLTGLMDSGIESGRPWFTSRYVHGRVLTGQRRSDADAMAIIGQIADALDHAHRRGVVHGDLGPAEVLLATDVEPNAPGTTVVLDVGTIALTGRPTLNPLSGTAEYTAPEIIAGQPARPASDQYALACLLFQLLTSTTPFADAVPQQTITGHLHRPAPPISAYRPDLAALDVAFGHALDKDPARRYPDCRAFVGTVATLRARATAAQSRPVAPAPASSLRGRAAAPVEPPTQAPEPAPVRQAPVQQAPVQQLGIPGETPPPTSSHPVPPPVDAPQSEAAQAEPARSASGQPVSGQPQPTHPEAPRPDAAASPAPPTLVPSDIGSSDTGSPDIGSPALDSPQTLLPEAFSGASTSVYAPQGNSASTHPHTGTQPLFAPGESTSTPEPPPRHTGPSGTDGPPPTAPDGSSRSRGPWRRRGIYAGLSLVAAVVIAAIAVAATWFVVDRDSTLAQVTTSTMSTGHGTTCAIRQSAAYCWGSNADGALGNGTTTDSNTPVKINGLNKVTSIAVGWTSACAIADGSLYCWGNNAQGQLGDGTTQNRPAPTKVANLHNVTSVAIGADVKLSGEAVESDSTSCAVADGGAYCWGANTRGQLGDGTTDSRPVPTKVKHLDDVVSLTTDSAQTCALTGAGDVYCWGANNRGQLADGTTVDQKTPVRVGGLSKVTDLATAVNSTCAVSDGSLYCWGNNTYGQTGGADRRTTRAPTQVTGLSNVSRVSMGSQTTCAVADGAVNCWGNNSANVAGPDPRGYFSTPTKIAGITGTASAVATDAAVACAQTGSKIYCWGTNRDGELGIGSDAFVQTPTEVTF